MFYLSLLEDKDVRKYRLKKGYTFIFFHFEVRLPIFILNNI